MIEVFFFLFFIMFFGVFIFTFVKGISQWNKNNQSPRLNVQVQVVAKRTNVNRRRNSVSMDHVGHSSSSTTYYVTFQVPSGDRMELQVNGYDYGMLVEGDRGELFFQGTRFLGFDRKYDTSDG